MKYKITVTEIAKKSSSPEASLEFDVESHDNLVKIVHMLEKNTDFDESDAAALGIGLKLFSGVMLKHKSNPLFKNLLPHFKDFMKGLKSSGKER